MPPPSSQVELDAEELFRLGLKASTDNDSASALGFLKAALQKDPAHARASWLLGAEYAQLGMMDRARQAMARALELDPELTGARFQFGLLYLTNGETVLATEIWAPLTKLPDDNPYKLFKEGLLHMVRDEFDIALSMIGKALSLPSADPALKKDMQMIIEQIEAVLAQKTATDSLHGSPSDDADKGSTAQDQLRFTAYRTPDNSR